jgi:hypothetical protein
LVTTGSLQTDGVVLAAAGDSSPLIVERVAGYGHVDFLAFDPGLAPFKGWKGLEGVFRSLFSSTTDRPGWAGAYRNWYNAGEAVNAIPGIGLPNVLQVCVFIVGYILAIGPINYLILRRFKRRELAWITIPVLVVLFTAGTYLASFGLRGSRATLHRLTVAQVWQNSSTANAETLVGIFSPRRSEYNLQVDGDMLLRPLPSDTNYGSIDTSLNGAFIDQGDTAAIRNVRVDVGAIKPFVAQGQIAAPQFESNLSYSMDNSQPTLKGTILNKSDLALKDAVVLAFSGFQKVGNVAPGAQVDVNLSLLANRASWAPQAQAPATTTSANPPAPATGSSSYDSTIENILGTQSYYDNRETYSRYSLLTWLFDPYNSGGRGTGTYLIGWTDKSPVNVSLSNESFNTADQTLYIVRLEPRMVINSGDISVPPGLMTWTVLDSGTSGASGPYDSYLSQGDFVVRFRPFAGLDFKKVKSLTLHLQSYSATGAAPLVIRLWNQSLGDWRAVPKVQWGNTLIEAPDQFVGGDGRIDVKVENTSVASVSLESLDFSLVVER